MLVGLVLALWWGGVDPLPRIEGLDDHMKTHAPIVARRFATATLAGGGAGLLMAGPGGRLVMRLLAVTAGDEAQGKLTEAEQRVGVITADGTIGLVVFGGLFLGLASGFIYFLVRRWLPAGRLRGPVFGLLLLLGGATTVEPLRPGNVDFDLVGPGWLAVLTFGSVVLVHGMLVAAIADRWEHFVVALRGRWAYAAYAPIVIFAPVLPFLIFVLIAIGVVTALSTQRQAADALASPRGLMAGRGALAALALVAAIMAIPALIDIAGRGPS